MEGRNLKIALVLGAALLAVTPLVSGPIGNHAVNGKSPFQTGTATWYGQQFHGRSTASGEAFDMFRLTAAHQKLPLGTFVRVTNLHNRKWVVVRINDRGPVDHSSIIDLSLAAAELLEMRDRGRAAVRLDLVAEALQGWPPASH